jgi:hypothetical protein
MADTTQVLLAAQAPRLHSSAITAGPLHTVAPAVKTQSSIAVAPVVLNYASSSTTPNTGDDMNVFQPSVLSNSIVLLEQMFNNYIDFANMNNQLARFSMQATVAFGQSQANAMYQKGLDTADKDYMAFGTDLSGAILTGATAAATFHMSNGIDEKMADVTQERTNAESWSDAYDDVLTKSPANRQVGDNRLLSNGVEVTEADKENLLRTQMNTRACGTVDDNKVMGLMDEAQLQRGYDAAQENIKTQNEKLNRLSNEKQQKTTFYQMLSGLANSSCKAGFDFKMAVDDARIGVDDKESTLFQTAQSLAQQMTSVNTGQRDRMLQGLDSMLSALQQAGQLSNLRG